MRTLISVLVLLCLPLPGLAASTKLSLDQALQRVVDNSLQLQVADLQAQRSALEKNKLDAMFGYTVGSKGTFAHDVGFGSIPQNTIGMNGSVSRLLTDGSVISATAGYTFADAELAILGLPNPSHDGTVDLSYRRPLMKGAGLPAYVQGKKRAAIGEKLTKLNRKIIQDQLANQTVEVFYALVSIQERIKNTRKGIKRTKRLLKYNKRNQELGLSEKKDILQVNAQIKAQEAELESLTVTRSQLMVSLNQLMNLPPEKEIEAMMEDNIAARDTTLEVILNQSIDHAPAIDLQEAQIEMAAVAIEQSKDGLKDNLDGFVSLGGRAKYGDTVDSTVNEQDYAVALGVEYKKTLDKSDVSAEISQAKIDRVIAQREIENIKRNLKFSIAGLLQEISKTGNTINAIKLRLDTEKEKLDEGVQRYRRGRGNTQQLILFENDLSLAQFLADQQKIELAKKYAKLDVISGAVWKRVIPLEKQ